PLDLRSFEDLDRVAGAQLHDGLLPAGARAPVEAAALRLCRHRDDVDARHLDVEQLLDRLPDLRLVRVAVNLERVAATRRALVRLLRDDGREDDLARVHQLALPWTSGSAASLTISERAQTTAPTSSSPGATTATRSMLRKLFTRFSSSCSATTTSGACLPHDSRSARADFVDGVPKCPASTTASVPSLACAASAERRAARCALRFTFWSKVRGVFANA